MESGVKYVTVSIPKAIADNIDHLIVELGYWPSRSSFVREACLEKIREEMLRLRELSRPVEEPKSPSEEDPAKRVVCKHDSEAG